MPTIDEELVQNAKAHFASKTDFSDKATFGSDVEVDGKLQVNTASDIVTKDGTSVGEYTATYPIFGLLSDDNALEILNALYAKENFVKTYSLLTPISVNNIDTFVLTTDSNMLNFSLKIIKNSNNFIEYVWCNSWNDDSGIIQYIFLIGSDNKIDYLKVLSWDIAVTIPTVWAQYRHTVDITGKNSKGTNYISLRFTALSSKNTPIDSIQDLITLFANTKLVACGNLNNNDDDSILTLIKGINVGTSITDTTLQYCDLTTETLTTYSTDFTITDNVTQD